MLESLARLASLKLYARLRPSVVVITARPSPGSNQIAFGDLNPSGIAPFDGDIAILCHRPREIKQQKIHCFFNLDNFQLKKS